MAGDGRYDLDGDLHQQPFAGDEFVRGGSGFLLLEKVGGVPQRVVADLYGAPQFVAVAADGRLDEAGVQGDKALQIAGGFGLDGPDAFARAGIERVGQVLHEQRGQGGCRQHDAEGDAVDDREGGRSQAQGRDNGGSGPCGQRAEADTASGTPGQPAHAEALGSRRDRGEHGDPVR